jgi:ParB-like chromosome segregation protein Spo0J
VYHLIAGEERYEAAKLLGWKEIDVAIFKGGKLRAEIWREAENIVRKKYTPLRQAEGVARLVKLYGKLIPRRNIKTKKGRPLGVVGLVADRLGGKKI